MGDAAAYAYLSMKEAIEDAGLTEEIEYRTIVLVW